MLSELTDGRSLAGGGNGGDPFSWNADASDIVLGFAGRSGARLDQVQLVVARLLPAKWVKIVTVSPTRTEDSIFSTSPAFLLS